MSPEDAKLAAKVSKIVGSLAAAKKAAPSKGGFRSFMKTAKSELQQMQLGATGAASAAAASENFTMTLAVPKGQPLVDLGANPSGEGANTEQSDTNHESMQAD